jgi:hypothetical protein
MLTWSGRIQLVDMSLHESGIAVNFVVMPSQFYKYNPQWLSSAVKPRSTRYLSKPRHIELPFQTSDHLLFLQQNTQYPSAA